MLKDRKSELEKKWRELKSDMAKEILEKIFFAAEYYGQSTNLNIEQEDVFA